MPSVKSTLKKPAPALKTPRKASARAKPDLAMASATTPEEEAAILQARAKATELVAAKKVAMGWMHTAKFLTTAAELHHLPVYDLPEIAFVGRSNAGKSTCINVLTQQKRLAFASKTPGRTQHINLFSMGKQNVHDAVLADLPGYGYAAVPKAAKYRWQQVMANYLASRANLLGVVMLCDPRHGIKDIDEALLEIIRPRVEDGLKFIVLLTKADKLNKTEAAKALSIASLQTAGGQLQLFSALNKQGVEGLAHTLREWVDDHAAKQAKLRAKAEAQGVDVARSLPLASLATE